MLFKRRPDSPGGRDRTKDMTAGPPLRLIVTFALPLMVGNIFQQCYTLADTVIVGKGVGVHALAAVGAASWMSWLVLSLMQGFTQGFSISVAQFFGAKDYKSLNRALQSSAVLTAALAAALLVLSQLLAVPTLRLMQTPDDIFADGLLYLRITFVGVPFVSAYNLLASTLTALGDGKSPLKAMLVASVTNIALDLLFVFAFGWGVAGVAIATVIAQGLAGFYCFVRLRGVSIIAPERGGWRAPRERALPLLRMGVPLAFQNIVICAGGMVVQSVVNGFGLLFIAGYTATNKLYGLLEIAAISFGYAVMTYVGQNRGAERPDRVSLGVRQGAFAAVGVSLVIAALIFLSGESLPGLFISGTPEEVAAATGVATSYLRIMASFLPILYILHVYRSALQGLGDTVTPMLSGVAEMLVRVAVALTLPALFGETSIFFSESAAWLGAVVILCPAYAVRIRRFRREHSLAAPKPETRGTA